MSLANTLQVEAFKHGFKLLPLEGGHTFACVPMHDKRSEESVVVSALMEVMTKAKAEPVGVPEQVGDVWVCITCKLDVVYNVMVMNSQRFQRASYENNLLGLIVLAWYMHGWVVAPGWWKLLNLLVLPSFYFSLEALWLQFIK